LTSVLLNQLPLPDLPETLITSLVFLHRVHPITAIESSDIRDKRESIGRSVGSGHYELES
jgi:hypothetical protein